MRSILIALILAAAAPAIAATEGFKARGFILPDGAVKIDDDRYRLPSGAPTRPRSSSAGPCTARPRSGPCTSRTPSAASGRA